MPTDEPAEANGLILEIYDTVVDAQRWPAVLEKVAHFIGARGAFVFELERSGGERRVAALHFSSGYDRELVDGYLAQHNSQELADQDRFAECSLPTDRIQLVSDEVLADSEDELLARPNVQQMLQYGIRFRAGALLNKDAPARDRFALQFSPRAGPMSADHVARADLVMPHIAKALNISRPTAELARAYRSVAECIDRLAVGVCVVNAKGAVVVTNREFERQLDRFRVFRRDGSGRLVMAAEGGRKAYGALCGAVDNHGRFGARPRKEAVVLDMDGEAHPLCIELAPLTSAGQFGEPHLSGHIIYSMDTSRMGGIDCDMLAEIFALTKAECAVLELMAEGLTNAQISERRAKSPETVNSQVKSILDKTGSANRTQAIRLAANISSSFVLERDHPNGGWRAT